MKREKAGAGLSTRARQREGLRVGDGREGGQEALAPPVHVLLANALQQGLVAALAFFQRHLQRALHGLGGARGVVGVHQQGLAHLLGGTGKAREHEHAGVVRVLRGAIFDVAVDLRRGSRTYGRWVGRELTAEAGNQLLVPIGFAHGFITLVPDTEVLYKVSAPYSKDHEAALRWDDPDIGIDWPSLSGPPTLSDKDLEAPSFAAFVTPFEYEN